MFKNALVAIGRHDRHVLGPVEIGRGYQASVELEPVSGIVCKQFHTPDAGEAAQFCRREIDYLRRFSVALAGQPFLSCPEPVDVDPEQGKVWMTYCPGSQLDHMLRDSPVGIESDLEHIARQIAIALETYIVTFNQACPDMGAWNMLYDEPTRTLSLIDFASTSDHWLRGFSDGHPPLDVTLGNLVGGSVYDTVRPAKWRNHTYWSRQQRLFGAVLARLLDHHDLNLTLVNNISHAAYDAMGEKNGSPGRRLWYATAGHVRFGRRINAIVTRTGAEEGSHV